MRLTRHRPNGAGVVKSETLNGTAAIASPNSEQQPQSELDSLRVAYTNGDSQTKDPDDETRNLSYDLPAERLPPPSSSLTTSRNKSRGAYHPEEHISRTKQLESLSASLESSASRVSCIIGLSNGASVHDPPAQRRAEPRRSQNWHYLGETFRSIGEKHNAIVATRIRVREERNCHQLGHPRCKWAQRTFQQTPQ